MISACLLSLILFLTKAGKGILTGRTGKDIPGRTTRILVKLGQLNTGLSTVVSYSGGLAKSSSPPDQGKGQKV